MGRCESQCSPTRIACKRCPFRPKSGEGCCDLFELSDRGLRTAYFALVALRMIVPQWNRRLTQALAVIEPLRDVTELTNSVRDFKELAKGELFETERHSRCAKGIDRAATGLGLCSSAFTIVNTLAGWDLFDLGRHAGWMGGVGRGLNASSYVTRFGSAAWDRVQADSTSDEECRETTREVVFSLSEALYQGLVEGLNLPEPLQVLIGLTSGSIGLYKVFST